MKKNLNILMAGGSGLLGNIVVNRLAELATVEFPVNVFSLSRSTSTPTLHPVSSFFSVTNLLWDGSAPPAIESPETITHVLNFCGENISEDNSSGLNRLGLRIWERPEKKDRIMSSRIVPTLGLKSWIESNCENVDYIVAGGVGVYGCDHFEGDGKEKEGEEQPFRKESRAGFLHEVSRNWEDAAALSPGSSSRTTILRIAPVITLSGGVLPKLLFPFKLGLGGVIGGGEQFFPFIGEIDFAKIVVDHIMLNNASSMKEDRIYNCIAPTDATNYQFTKALGSILCRPTLFPMPSFIARYLFGQMGEEVLLGGVRCAPQRLLNEGYIFECPNITSVLDSAMKNKYEQ